MKIRQVRAVLRVLTYVSLLGLAFSSLGVAAAELALNGVASYQDLNTEYFLAGLYLSTASSDATEILAMKGQKRMEMRVTSDNFSPRKFAGLWRDSIVINNSPSDVDKFGPDMLRFSSIMKGRLVTGDQVIIDQSSSATVISINGNELARFGPEFFPILLRTWIGPRPASSDFKKDLLGKGVVKEEYHARYANIVPLDGRKQLATLWATTDDAAVAKAAEEARAQAIADEKAEAEAKIKAKAEAQARAESEAKAKAEAQARADAEAKAKAEALARTQAEAKAKAEAQARADAEAKAKAEAQTRAQAEAKAKAEAQASIDAEAKAKAEAAKAAKAAEDARVASLKASSDAQAQAKAKSDAEAKAKAAEEASQRAEQEAKARVAAEAQAKLEEAAHQKAEAQAKVEAQARVDAEAKAKAEAQARSDAEAQAKADAQARADAEAKAKAAQAKADAEAEERAQAAKAEEAKKRAAETATAAAAKVNAAPPAKPEVDEDNAAVELDAAQAARELYKSKLVAWVYKSLEYPEKEKRSHREGNIKLKVIITRDGKVVDAALVEETKYPPLNVAAKNAARLAQPYPPVPKEIEGNTFEFIVPILFRSE